MVYLAKKFHHKENGEATFTQALQWTYGMIKPIAGKVKCDTSLIIDPLPKEEKVCFCEPEAPQPPTRCGGEGDVCTCRGTVFYGAAQHSDGDGSPFEGLRDQRYHFKSFEGSPGEIECTNKAFGGDPLPYISKECFCDKHMTISKKTIDLDTEEFKLKAMNEAMAAQIAKIKAEAAALEIEAK